MYVFPAGLSDIPEVGESAYFSHVYNVFPSAPLIKLHLYFVGSVLSVFVWSVYCPMYFLLVPTAVLNPVLPSAESA